jgi:hypothetical protein
MSKTLTPEDNKSSNQAINQKSITNRDLVEFMADGSRLSQPKNYIMHRYLSTGESDKCPNQGCYAHVCRWFPTGDYLQKSGWLGLCKY